MIKLDMKLSNKLKSYILPITAIVIIPAIILSISKDALSDNILIVIVSIFIISLSLVFLVYTIVFLEKEGKGTLAPWSPPQKLVITGPYKYIRNPMIASVFFVISGMALVFTSVGLLIWALCFYIINTVYFIFSEEKGLVKRFGDQYIEYKQNVPMWFPKIKK